MDKTNANDLKRLTQSGLRMTKNNYLQAVLSLELNQLIYKWPSAGSCCRDWTAHLSPLHTVCVTSPTSPELPTRCESSAVTSQNTHHPPRRSCLLSFCGLHWVAILFSRSTFPLLFFKGIFWGQAIQVMHGPSSKISKTIWLLAQDCSLGLRVTIIQQPQREGGSPSILNKQADCRSFSWFFFYTPFCSPSFLSTLRLLGAGTLNSRKQRQSNWVQQTPEFLTENQKQNCQLTILTWVEDGGQ